MQGRSFFRTVMTGLPRSSEHKERETFPISMCEGCFLTIFYSGYTKQINLQNISYPKAKFTIVNSNGKLKY